MGTRWIAASVAIATLGAAAAVADAPVEHAALRDVLGEAPTIVRASATETTATVTRVLVLETLRGAVEGDAISVRQPAGEEPLARGEDVILLLDVREADGAYPLHHPAGRYRVEASADGDVVVVNANGIDGAAVSPKDLRPRAPDERVPLATFRALVGPSPTPPPRATEPALSPPPPRPHSTPEMVQPTPAPAPEQRPARWPWVLFGLCLGLAIAVFVRRRR